MNLEQTMSQTELRNPVKLLKPQTRSAITSSKASLSISG